MKYFTTQEIEALDDYAAASGLSVCQMMELSGTYMPEVFKRLGFQRYKRVVVCCGAGNNGGNGLSAARWLISAGYSVKVILLKKNLKLDPKQHLSILEHMQVPIMLYEEVADEAHKALQEADVIIDALLGYHIEGAPRGIYAEIIEYINNLSKPVVAYDMPSGIDATTGECEGVCVTADTTLTLMAPKQAFQTEKGKVQSGKVFVADLGIPEAWYNHIMLESRPAFETDAYNLIEL